MALDRRTFLKGGTAAAAGVAFAGPFEGFLARAAGAAAPPGPQPLAPVADLRDQVLRLALPPGFAYRSFDANVPAVTMSDGATLPGNHDGGFDEFANYFTTEELWFPEWEFKGTPWQRPELYEKFSPSRYVGNWQTPTKFSGYRLHTRWISSLQCSVQCLLVASLPTWCPIALARGEKIVRSVPRERCSLSCAFSRLSRIWSSLMVTLPLAGTSDGVLSASVCCLRQAFSGSGAVV